MNEFIVWDEKQKKFIQPSREIVMTTKDGLLKGINGGNGFVEQWKPFSYIGKTDINNKKIYADCSILEFKMYGTKSVVSVKGYFYWSCEKLRYKFMSLVVDNYPRKEKNIEWNRAIGQRFKIIDTIQENKLGLI
ncbi:hypothetical protein [Sulfurimonas sp.]|uniref:hypothetical protein n=1 Tax=Sulfurimonas sp. TaxID=2022749 RepID=UPI003568DC00